MTRIVIITNESSLKTEFHHIIQWENVQETKISSNFISHLQENYFYIPHLVTFIKSPLMKLNNKYEIAGGLSRHISPIYSSFYAQESIRESP